MKILKNLIPILVLFLTLSFISHKALSVECEPGFDKNAASEVISKCEEKIADLQRQEDSLSSEIELFDTKIYLTELQITETENKIKNTEEEIEQLGGRITNLDTSLDHLSKILLQKIVAGYKHREAPLFDVFLDSENASVLANRLKYAKVAEENDRELAFQLQKTKLNYELQRDLREEKKKELDDLSKQLDVQKSDLDSQKKGKQELLRITQNDEARYQTLLRQALAEFRAIQNALATGVSMGPVKRGDPIGLVGNSGSPNCSTGAHLHFEVHTSSAWNSWTDPGPYLSQWQNPLSDPVIVTQSYGQTEWSSRYQYSGGIHTGIDMYSSSSDVIRAPSDGTLYSSTWGCEGSSPINVRYIEHSGGIYSFYLHVQ